jgi:RNA polymerase sigma-70 factor (ECF subfamily)
MTEAQRRSAYEQWVRAHGAELFRCAYRLTGKTQVAEDLVQETFVEAWRSADKLRDPEKARGWLFQILRFRHLHAIRDGKRRMEGQPGRVPLTADVPTGDTTAGVEQRDAIQVGLACLDQRLRETLLMVVMEGLTAQEAADRLGLPMGTVLSRLHRARERLREVMAEDKLGIKGLK